MTDAWIKNLCDRISIAEKIDRIRERNLLELESEEQKLSRDMRDVSMCESEVKEKEVEVNRLEEELMLKMEELALEKVAIKVEMEELDKKRDALFIKKDKILTEKGMLKDLKETEWNRIEKLIRQKNELKDAMKNKRQAREMKQFLRETIERKELSLGCPVCTELAEAPIFCCSEQHLICKICKSYVKRCPICRESYGRKGARRHRGAEQVVEEIKELRVRLGR